MLVQYVRVLKSQGEPGTNMDWVLPATGRAHLAKNGGQAGGSQRQVAEGHEQALR